jgi:hypothetical protein
MSVKKILATLPLVLNACGSEDASTDYTPNELGQGIWEGGFSASVISTSGSSGAVPSSELTKIQASGVGLFTTDKRAFFYNEDNDTLFANDTPGFVNHNLSYSPDYYQNGNVLNTITFSGNAYISTSITGGYQEGGGGISGYYVMLFDDKYFRGANLTRLQASWSYTDSNSGAVWDLSIQANGSFTLTSTIVSGCTGAGSFSTIDTAKNEYAISVTLDSNCYPYNGSYQGLAATIDTNVTNDTILMAIYNADHGFFMKPQK